VNDQARPVNIKIDYEGGAGTDRRKFSLEITGLDLPGHDAHKTRMVQGIVAALTAGDAQWVLDLGDVHRESEPSPRMLPPGGPQ
jgi:hypothetical protein